jgi:hypothetical protein
VNDEHEKPNHMPTVLGAEKPAYLLMLRLRREIMASGRFMLHHNDRRSIAWSVILEVVAEQEAI